VWAFIVFSGFYLLMQLLKDSCEYFFSPRHSSGKALLMDVGDRSLEQASTLQPGFGRAALLLSAVIMLFVGGIGTTLGQLANKIGTILGDAGLRKLNIVPGHLLNATLELMFPLDIDPEQVQNLLFDTYEEHETILENRRRSCVSAS
jgi:hypothetical protein